MQETLTFKFLLTILKPCSLTLSVGEQQLTKNFEQLGRAVFPITFATEIDKFYTVKLVSDHTIPVALIDNVEVVWHDDEKITPVWRVASDNEVWDYLDKDATRRAQAFETSPALRTMSLDYMIDVHLNGYLNNFAVFKDSQGTVHSLTSNGNQAFILDCPGEFTFKFKAPAAYWFFKRLFAKPQTQG